MDQLSGLLQTYQDGQTRPDEVTGHFDQVARAAPPDDLAEGLSAAFRSDQTPPFAQMVSQLFGASDNNQRAGLLNTLLAGAGGSGLLKQLASAAGRPAGNQIDPELAGNIPLETVQQAAEQAEKQDPSIIDRVSQIYAKNPTLFNILGTTALSLAMQQMARRRSV